MTVSAREELINDVPTVPPVFCVPLQFFVEEGGVDVILCEFLDKPFAVGPAQFIVVSTEKGEETSYLGSKKQHN